MVRAATVAVPLAVAVLLAPALAGCLGDASRHTGPAGLADDPPVTASASPVATGADEAVTSEGNDASDGPSDVSGERAVRDLEEFTRTAPLRHSDLPTHDAAVRWLVDSFNEIGLETFVHEARVDPPTFPSDRPCPARNYAPDRDRVRNVVALQRGATFPNRTIVVAAHYDGKIGGVGHAYDPGSATVTLVELARAVAQEDLHHTIIFAGWDGHECNFLLGSNAWVQDPEPEDVNVSAVVTLDMVGINWPADGPTIHPLHGWIGNDDGTLRRTYRDATFGTLEYPEGPIAYHGSCDGCNSHAPFAAAGIPYIFFSTFDFGSQGIDDGTHYPFWHRLDTVEQMTAWAGNRTNLERGFDTVLEVNHHGLVQLDETLADTS